MRNYSIVKRQNREIRMKQVADAGRNAAVQRIKAYNGYRGNKMNNFSAKYDNIMRNSTQNMKHLYNANGVAKATKSRTIYDEAKAYDPEKSDFTTTLADYALDWIEDYEGLGDAYHINGESKHLYLSESSRDNLATIDTHDSSIDSDDPEQHKSSISIYNTKPVITSDFDPFGLFTPPVIQKKQVSPDSARSEYNTTNNAEENIEYEIEEEEEEVEVELVNEVANDQNILDQNHHEEQHDRFAAEEVSGATVVAADTKKGGFLSSLSSFFFGKKEQNSVAKSTVTGAINDQVDPKSASKDKVDTANETSVATNLLTPFAATKDSDSAVVTVVTGEDTKGSTEDESSSDYETLLDKRGEDWASSLFKN